MNPQDYATVVSLKRRLERHSQFYNQKRPHLDLNKVPLGYQGGLHCPPTGTETVWLDGAFQRENQILRIARCAIMKSAHRSSMQGLTTGVPRFFEARPSGSVMRITFHGAQSQLAVVLRVLPQVMAGVAPTGDTQCNHRQALRLP